MHNSCFKMFVDVDVFKEVFMILQADGVGTEI